MASEVQQGLMPSILDRLIDPDSKGTEPQPWYNLDRMLQVVRRDLEDLLNTRATTQDVPLDLVRLRRSVFSFGLPDLTSFNALTTQQRQEIGQVLEDIIALHEPRLKDIHATLLENLDYKKPSVRFRLEARVALDPAPEVAFDTILELATGHHSVVKG